MDRFQQECGFLESIRHPNIVQYLGMTRDPESRLVGRSPTFAGRGGRLGITRIPGFVPTAEKLQSNQIAGFKWLLTASLARSVNRLVGDVNQPIHASR